MTMTTTTDIDIIYISPYEIRRPRGRPKKEASESAPKTPAPKPKTPAPKPKTPGRPRREVPLTPEEMIERRRRYKDNANATELKQEYERFYQQCYYQRPEVKQRKTEYKKKIRSAEREARQSQ